MIERLARFDLEVSSPDGAERDRLEPSRSPVRR